MFNYFKRPKCKGCKKRFKKGETGSEIQLETLDGLHTITFCDDCSSVIEDMRLAFLKVKKNESV